MTSSVDPTLRGQGELVLIVDDESRVAQLAGRALRACGYEVLVARSASEALKRTAHLPERLDVLITDIVMPHMGGRKLAERLSERHPDIKVLYVSGHSREVLFEQNVLEEHAHFLAKPFEPVALLRSIRALIDEA